MEKKTDHAQILKAQANEITEYVIYSKLAGFVKSEKDSEVLRQIAFEEKKHAQFWQKYTNTEVKPNVLKVALYLLSAKLMGLTFTVKLMEKGEELAQINYKEIAKVIPQVAEIEKEEAYHEKQLLNLIDEERLKYIGSMVLGVNDALVELTGALAGLTFALQNTKLIALTGLITGIAASLSMAGSEYLSTKAESQDKNPLKAAIYTGSMYVVTVFLLIIPFFIFLNVFISLSVTLTVAVCIIFFFTMYISVAQDLPFKKRFMEMAGISLSVSAITFIIGFILRKFIGVDI